MTLSPLGGLNTATSELWSFEGPRLALIVRASYGVKPEHLAVWATRRNETEPGVKDEPSPLGWMAFSCQSEPNVCI